MEIIKPFQRRANSHLLMLVLPKIKSEEDIGKVVKLSDMKIRWIVRHYYITA